MAGFREGWALKTLTATKAHYFRRHGVGLAVSLCGSHDGPAGWLTGYTGAEQCKRCAKLVGKEVAKSAAMPPEAGQDERGRHRTCDGKAKD